MAVDKDLSYGKDILIDETTWRVFKVKHLRDRQSLQLYQCINQLVRYAFQNRKRIIRLETDLAALQTELRKANPPLAFETIWQEDSKED